MNAAFIHSDEIERYHYPDTCPFKTERAAMTREKLRKVGQYDGDGRREVAPGAAGDEELRRFHTAEYLDVLKRISAGTIGPEDLFFGVGTDDTPVFFGLYEYARLAAGASLCGARLVCDGEARVAFNPSGGFHHAQPAEAGGFCYINDIVLACMYLRERRKRVCCLDLDAHHGNGTQDAFYRTSDVLTVSFHESGKTIYPWGGFEQEIGEDEGKGYNVNLPLPRGTDDETYTRAFRELVPPLLDWYRPDVLVVEIGMDVLGGDPLVHLNMTNNVFADILPGLIARNIPLLVTGGGGYHPENTARGWARVWTILCGLENENDEWIGLGGTFLGTSEWSAGFRDMRTYARGPEQETIRKEVAESVETVKKLVFAPHGL